MWRFSRKKPFFSPEENEQIVRAIQEAEKQTSGEIRIFVEGHCKYVDALDRAAEIFARLQMEKTELRNGVLFYIAITDKQFAVFADSGIHQAAGKAYWEKVIKEVVDLFRKESIVAGMVNCITKIGDALKTYFPYDKKIDRNELPDEIVFGS